MDLGGVQLWENGPYWAECNVGANKPEEYGYYFWWGDTVGYKRVNNAWVASDGSSSNFSFEGGNAPTYGYGKDNATLLAEGWIDSTGNLVAAHDAATAKAMAERLETERILDVVGVWAREGDSSGAEKRLLYFVPVKTESFYADSRNCRNPRDGDIEKAVRELYSDRVGGVCENSRIAVELRPVDTYGCVALEKARWNRAEGVLEEEFRIEGGNMINPCGAVDLFSSVLRRRMANLEAVTRRDAEKSREAIEERGIFSRVWHLIFGDDEKQRLAGSEAAAELYRAGLEAIAGFSSGNRAAVLR